MQNIKKKRLNLEEKNDIAAGLRGNLHIFSGEKSRDRHISNDYRMRLEELEDADVDAAEAREKLEEYAEEIRENSFSAKWPTELNDFLEEKVGHLFYVMSPPVDIIGDIELVYDMYMPRRITTSMMATNSLLEAMKYYADNNIGPVPCTWIMKNGRHLVPTTEILRFKFKTANPSAGPTEEQRGKWKIAETIAPTMYSNEELGMSDAPAIYEDPAICYFLYGGRKEPVNTDLGISLAHIIRVVGGAKINGRSEDRAYFFNCLRRKFPNYARVLIDMGWTEKTIPSSPEDLPKALFEAYEKVEMFEHQAMKEQIYRLSKTTGNVSQMSSIIKSMDDETIMKRSRSKRKDAEKDGGGSTLPTATWT